jgi:hypothetical protein
MSRVAHVGIIVLASWLFAGSDAFARPSGADPVATTADFAWLEGSWEGRFSSGPATGVAEVTFQKPTAGLVTGLMRLVDNGKILVVELISVVDAPRGLELRFRHFSSTLDAYESDFKQTMRIQRSPKGSFVFENIVPFDKKLLSTQPRVTHFTRRGDDEFVGHSDTIDSEGKPGIVEMTYRRVHRSTER